MLKPHNGSTMVTSKGIDKKTDTVDNKRNDQSRASNRDNRDNLWSIYCQKAKHTQEKCQKLLGKPTTSHKEQGYNGEQLRDNG